MFDFLKRKKLSLMLVDDDIRVCQAFKRQAFGLSVVTAFTDPVVALKSLVDDDNYSAVLSDLRMPVMSGIDFLTRVRAINATIPIFLFTGVLDHPELRTKLSQIGIQGTFFKPLNSVTVLDHVRRSVSAPL